MVTYFTQKVKIIFRSHSCRSTLRSRFNEPRDRRWKCGGSCRSELCSRSSKVLFQSRNQEAFDFNYNWSDVARFGPASFNLVIEVLLISSLLKVNVSDGTLAWFQSRNRGSFDFKSWSVDFVVIYGDTFQSRNRGSFDFKNLWGIASLNGIIVSIS